MYFNGVLGCFNKIKRVFQESFEGVSRKVEGCFNGVQGCLKEVQGVFEDSFKGVSRMFLRCFNKD